MEQESPIDLEIKTKMKRMAYEIAVFFNFIDDSKEKEMAKERNNTPENLIWVKDDAKKKIGTPREQKLKVHFDEDKEEIKRIIEEIN